MPEGTPPESPTPPPSVPQPRQVFSQRLVQYMTALRLFLRDFPELNRLIAGYESDPRFLAWALMDALDQASNTPPWVGRYSIETFGYPSLLIRLAAANALESVSILSIRNHVAFSDGGISVDYGARIPALMNLTNLLRSRAEAQLQQWKVAQNIDAAWDGGVHSDYWYLNGYYGS